VDVKTKDVVTKKIITFVSVKDNDMPFGTTILRRDYKEVISV